MCRGNEANLRFNSRAGLKWYSSLGHSAYYNSPGYKLTECIDRAYWDFQEHAAAANTTSPAKDLLWFASVAKVHMKQQSIPKRKERKKHPDIKIPTSADEYRRLPSQSEVAGTARQGGIMECKDVMMENSKYAKCISRLVVRLGRCSTCCCATGRLSSAVEHQLLVGNEKDCTAWFSVADAAVRLVVGVWRSALFVQLLVPSCST